MGNLDYPEEAPDDLMPLETFVFSRANLNSSKKDIHFQTEAFEERISKISRKCLINDQFELIPQILNVTRNPEELKRLSKGLARIAEIVAQYDEVKKKAIVLEVAESDPSWLAWAFGDFGLEDKVIENFLDGENDARSSSD